jgi:hypothetical protein
MAKFKNVPASSFANETIQMLHEAFGEHSLSRTVAPEWHSRFRAGRVSVEDDERSGRPSTRKATENVEKIRHLIQEDHGRTIHELTDNTGISYGVSEEILTENLNIRRIAAKLVSRLLTNDEKQLYVNLCFQLREKTNENQTFISISRIVTGDESWIYGYDPETKQQLSQKKSPQSQ